MPNTASPCQPTTVVCGDIYCLDLDCDHERSADAVANPAGGSYCDDVREETVCGTHSRFVAAEDGFDELVEAAPWPCATP